MLRKRAVAVRLRVFFSPLGHNQGSQEVALRNVIDSNLLTIGKNTNVSNISIQVCRARSALSLWTSILTALSSSPYKAHLAWNKSFARYLRATARGCPTRIHWDPTTKKWGESHKRRVALFALQTVNAVELCGIPQTVRTMIGGAI